jgi:hypothetical protein
MPDTIGRDDHLLLVKKLQTCILISSWARYARYHAAVSGHSPVYSQDRIIVVHTG